MDYSAGTVDTNRPWIRDERDVPGNMNWCQTLFNPFGKTYKLHFTRAWTFMFMGRLMLYVFPSFVAFLPGVAGVGTDGMNTPVSLVLFSVPALLVPFAVLSFVPLPLIEPRYYLVAFSVFLAFRPGVSMASTAVTLAYYVPVSAYLLLGISRQLFFL